MNKGVKKNNKTLVKKKPFLVTRTEFFLEHFKLFWKKYWIGSLVILLATFIFFWPIIIRSSSYSEGGDAMFNAWTLARNHHCILREGCPNYTDANIYFPHKDTMLYSETQLSAGVLTLPLYFINHNPLFAYNIMTITSFFLSGWFMYLLAKRLSKGNEIFSVLAGLVFEFAPLKIAATSHLQNLSIFYLPLAFLLAIKFLDSKSRKYLIALFITLTLQFYASWYQMAFVLMAFGVLLVCALIFRIVSPKNVLLLALTVVLATAVTLPLAKEYTRFSKANQASFSIEDQATYSASLADYAIPNKGTIIGKLYYNLRPQAKVNSYNPDSYSYHGMVLYVVAVGVLAVSFIRRKKGAEEAQNYKMVMTFVTIGILGFIVSLGPLLKFKGSLLYAASEGIKFAIPLPYLLVNKLLPQLGFIRAIGRASVLCLFALCSVLALAPHVVSRDILKGKMRYGVVAAIVILVFIELLPIHMVSTTSSKYSNNLSIPAVYRLIKADKKIDNIVILNADKDYPGATIPLARAEWVLWAGYHNKKIFNGYSGYTPKEYFSEYDDFVDFQKDDVSKMTGMGLRYVLVDKLLSSSKPQLNTSVSKILKQKVYEDSRYALYGL